MQSAESATHREILSALERGIPVITSNARAARALRLQYGRLQVARGRAAWPAADVLHWDGWLDRWWREQIGQGVESRLLLSPLQEERTWIRVIRPGIEGRRLISTEGVAELAQEAYSLLCSYDARSFLQQSNPNGTDIDSFREWARSFEALCRREQWITRGLLPVVLEEAVKGGSLPLSRELLLLGFDRLTPAQERLLRALEQRGCAVRTMQAVHADSQDKPRLIAASELREELAACASWLRARLRGDEAVRLAVIVPKVQEARREMERIFRQALAPESIPITGSGDALPFEFSLGEPLSNVPMVRSALLLLRWMEQPLEQEDVTWLMLSGFLHRHADDLLAVAAFDADTRSTGVLPPEQTIDVYLGQSRWGRSAMLRDLQGRMRKARSMWRDAARERRTFSEWSSLVQRSLSEAGWPGAHPLESVAFQTRKKWLELLDAMESLDFDNGRVDRAEFLRLLEAHAARVVFSPESSDAPVQIMGPFEAAGQSFDAVWFLGADDANWPTAARPHPFLPLALQRERGMPHADSAQDWRLTHGVTKRILASAGECVFSYSQQNRDGLLRRSPLLGNEAAELASSADRETIDAAAMEQISEAARGILWQQGHEAGGYSVLKMQAACPFQSFATVRLGARALNRAEWGLDARDRGVVLHGALQTLWAELQDRDALLAARDSGELRTAIERHVRQALVKCAGEIAQEGWSRAYLEAEEARVCALIDEWLCFEQHRSFFRVEKSEETMMAQVGALQLKLRADRVDKVADGRLLIDYKTGKVSSSSWEGDRPDEPQLPLYAIFGSVQNLRGVLMAQVRRGELKLEGRVEDADAALGPGLLSSGDRYSPEVRAEWESVLLRLANDFVEGAAAVDPKIYPKTCQYCALKSLCRVAELTGTSIEEAGEANGNGHG